MDQVFDLLGNRMGISDDYGADGRKPRNAVEGTFIKENFNWLHSSMLTEFPSTGVPTRRRPAQRSNTVAS